MELARSEEESSVATACDQGARLLLSHQTPDGCWCYTVEANESIGAGFIQLMHFLRDVDSSLQKGLAIRVISQQREDGSWALFYGGPGDISITLECYFA